jgi:hypothetical protein
VSYLIELADLAAEKIRRFRPDVFEEVVEELDRLGKDPTLGTPIPSGPYAGRMAFTFVVSRRPGAWRFSVFYRFMQDEMRIWVYDFGILKGDPPMLYEAEPLS